MTPLHGARQVDDDELPVGRILSRREVRALFGSGRAVENASGELPKCVAVPDLTEGPYYVEDSLERADIRTDTADGSTAECVPLTLAWIVSVVDGTACMPIRGAVVDLWHCDAQACTQG